MAILILGLVIFLGVHSTRIFADDWRTAMMGRIGEKAWKGGYTLLSILGFVLIVWGFSLARQQPLQLWMPPRGMRHLAALLTLIAFVLLAATYVPRNVIKARLHHPMVLSVKVWALAHLLANGNLAHVLLFGAFLVWAALSFRAARARDSAAGTLYPAGTAAGTLATVVVGIAAWAVFAFWAHGLLIGIRPIG
ncbi:NnrU family protein [Polaromonas sp. UC242_47]|uniref:NnrU family protein n=1 Tax=Polaromonas sp. UC242_47 TaxID=3374626 RepID=UPI0037970337